MIEIGKNVDCINAAGYDRDRVKEVFQYVLKEDNGKVSIRIGLKDSWKGAHSG